MTGEDESRRGRDCRRERESERGYTKDKDDIRCNETDVAASDKSRPCHADARASYPLAALAARALVAGGPGGPRRTPLAALTARARRAFNIATSLRLHPLHFILQNKTRFCSSSKCEHKYPLLSSFTYVLRLRYLPRIYHYRLYDYLKISYNLIALRDFYFLVRRRVVCISRLVYKTENRLVFVSAVILQLPL